MKNSNKLEMQQTILKSNKVLKFLTITLITIAIVTILSSCSQDTSGGNLTDCNCGTVANSTVFNIPENGGVHQFSVVIVKNNCTQVTKQVQKEGNVRPGTQLCNY